MSEKETKSSPATQQPLKHGEEPSELLLAVIWSEVETLLARGEARLFVGADEVAIIFQKTVITKDGLVRVK